MISKNQTISSAASFTMAAFTSSSFVRNAMATSARGKTASNRTFISGNSVRSFWTIAVMPSVISAAVLSLQLFVPIMMTMPLG